MTGSTFTLDTSNIGGANFPRTRRVDPAMRKERVMNAKDRTIGVDKEYLDDQVKQKQEASKAEKEQDM